MIIYIQGNLIELSLNDTMYHQHSLAALDEALSYEYYDGVFICDCDHLWMYRIRDGPLSHSEVETYPCREGQSSAKRLTSVTKEEMIQCNSVTGI